MVVSLYYFIFFLSCALFALLSNSTQELHGEHRAHHSFDQVMRNFYKLQKNLDSVMARKKQVGHMGWLSNMPMYFWRIAHSPNINTICEVGFGVGFSSTLFLTAGNATMISFDLFPEIGSRDENDEMGDFMKSLPLTQTSSRNMINQLFPNRFTAYPGYSQNTVPDFIKNNTQYKCDLIYNDGSHMTEPTLTDIRNFKGLAHKDTIVLFDDIECIEVQTALETSLREGILNPYIECIEGEVLIDPNFGHPGWNRLAKGKKYCRTTYNL